MIFLFAESSTESKPGEVSDKADAIPDAVTCSEAAAAKPDPAAADAVVTSSAESASGKLAYRLKNFQPVKIFIKSKGSQYCYTYYTLTQ